MYAATGAQADILQRVQEDASSWAWPLFSMTQEAERNEPELQGKLGKLSSRLSLTICNSRCQTNRRVVFYVIWALLQVHGATYH